MKDNFKIDFVGIGAPKCATTWIYECLKEHPEICMSKPKETNFFKKKVARAEELRSYFSHCKENKIRGEFSPEYFIYEDVAKRLREHNPDMKIIMAIRNPIERAYSNYLQGKSIQNKGWVDFKQAIKTEPKIIEYGFYFKNLQNFLHYFFKEQILVLVLEDSYSDPLSFIQNLYSFLGADNSFIPAVLKTRVSPTVFKLTKFGKVVHKGIGRPLGRFKMGTKIKKSKIIRKPYLKIAEFYTRNAKKPAIDKEIISYLNNIYKPDIKKLEKFLPVSSRSACFSLLSRPLEKPAPGSSNSRV